MEDRVVIEVYGNGRYYIDRVGVVYSTYKGFMKERALGTNDRGYKTIGLTYGGVARYFKVHRLVAFAFIPNPLNKPFINHKDGDKSNNRVGNLEWVTSRENNAHAEAMGLMNHISGEKHPKSVLSDKEIAIVRHRIMSASFKSVYQDYKERIGWWSFRDICRGKSRVAKKG